MEAPTLEAFKARLDMALSDLVLAGGVPAHGSVMVFKDLTEWDSFKWIGEKRRIVFEREDTEKNYRIYTGDVATPLNFPQTKTNLQSLGAPILPP